MTDQKDLPFLVAIETDALRYHGEHPLKPALLTAADAEQVLAHLSSDLAALFPDIARHSLVTVGALFDQTQLLQPGLPLFKALSSVSRKRLEDNDYRPSLLALGTAGGHMPDPSLVPDPAVPPGILQLLPCQVCGDRALLQRLDDEMEHRFMEEGQLSPRAAQSIEGAFGISSSHARFMTMTDLLAMLKLQLEHFGFEGLWTLLDAAMNRESEPVEITGKHGPCLSWRDGEVSARFETFDYWAAKGAGRAIDRTELDAGYVAWTQEYRQYLVTLQAHGIEVSQRLPGTDTPLEGSFLVESVPYTPDDSAGVTEHAHETLGLIAVTVRKGDLLLNHYPLEPQGLNDLHAQVFRESVVDGGLSFPGSISFDPGRRQLRPGSL